MTQSAIQRPVQAKLNPSRKTTTLWFDDKTSSEVYLRGGMCFPRYWQPHVEGVIEGGAVLLGLDVRTGVATEYEAMRWYTVEPVNVSGEGAPEFAGIGHWFNMVWSTYYSRRFDFHQDEPTVHKWRLQVRRAAMVRPKPLFIEQPWPRDAEQAEYTILEWNVNHRLRMRKGGELLNAVQRHSERPKMPGMVLDPMIHALICVLIGYDQRPWRDPEKDRGIDEAVILG